MEWSDNRAHEDLTQCSDTDLLRLVQEQQHRGAATVLLLRWAWEICRLAVLFARPSGLGSDEVDDAQQEALMAVYRSLGAFDLSQEGGTHPCRFRSFLHRVVKGSVVNFLRHRAREQGHDRLAAARVGQAAAPGAEGTLHWLSPPAGWRDEPSLAAQKQEGLEALEEFINDLDEDAQQLCLALRAGGAAVAVAAKLGCAVRTVRRRREKLVGTLQAHLAGRF